MKSPKDNMAKKPKEYHSYIQRMLHIGYGMADRIIDELEDCGYIGASRGPNKPREILKPKWEG